MNEILAFDSKRNTIEKFVQWDNNLEMYINWDYLDITPIFHFTNTRSDRILVVKGEVIQTDIDIVAKANVPNILLTESYPVMAYVYLEEEEGDIGYAKGETIYTIRIPIEEKPRPEDYKYFENTEYISWMKLEQEVRYRIEKLIVEGNEALGNLVSPTINVSQKDNTVTIKFTDTNGTQTLKLTGVTAELS